MNKTLLRLYAFLTALIVCNILLDFSARPLSLWGHYSDRVLRWTWFALTVTVITVFWKHRAARGYLVLLLAGFGLSILPMGVPLAMALQALTDDGLRQRVPVNSEYRVERRRPLFNDVQVQLFRRTGILEQELGARNYADLLAYASGKKQFLTTGLNPEFPRERDTDITGARFLHATEDSVTIEYSVLGKQVVLAHPVRRED
ncbi:hypothetical protein [Flaviaesturariibacter amylovorans]|uniref:Uncharacterized protein n=1 Tax=Flaviaesturariibacter amylovorans TaxID=1084520 RepID=A0ABP8H3J1_9BACT